MKLVLTLLAPMIEWKESIWQQFNYTTILWLIPIRSWILNVWDQRISIARINLGESEFLRWIKIFDSKIYFEIIYRVDK